MRGPMLAGVVVAVGVGAVAAYLSASGPSADLPAGATSATTAAPATTAATSAALPATPATPTGGSGAVLANEEAHYPTPEEIERRAKITHVLDYVCKKQVPIDTELSAMHLGGTYKFCSAECRDKFAADPEAYLNK